VLERAGVGEAIEITNAGVLLRVEGTNARYFVFLINIKHI
jgi:hypothetical protein